MQQQTLSRKFATYSAKGGGEGGGEGRFKDIRKIIHLFNVGVPRDGLHSVVHIIWQCSFKDKSQSCKGNTI